MTEDVRTIERMLRSRRNELRELVRQMKADNMNNHPVFMNLDQELQTIEQKLRNPEDLVRKP